MSKESIVKMLEAEGTFPEEEVVFANFDKLFALARTKTETVEDLAYGFALALDQWGHVADEKEPSFFQPTRDWAMAQWELDSYERARVLSRVLVNVPSPEVTAFLQRQHDSATNADIRSELAFTLQELSD